MEQYSANAHQRPLRPRFSPASTQPPPSPVLQSRSSRDGLSRFPQSAQRVIEHRRPSFVPPLEPVIAMLAVNASRQGQPGPHAGSHGSRSIVPPHPSPSATRPALSALTSATRGRRRRRNRRLQTNPEVEVDAVIGLYSRRLDYIEYFPAVFSQRSRYSFIHPSILDEIQARPMDLPPTIGLPRNILTPFGRIRPRRYVRLALHMALFGIHCQFGELLVLDDPIPFSGPYIYLGQGFLRQNFGGSLPCLWH